MPRYFFDVDDGMTLHTDEIGRSCPSDGDAKREGRGLLGLLVKHHLDKVGGDRTFTVWVRNADGDGLFRLDLVYSADRLVA